LWQIELLKRNITPNQKRISKSSYPEGWRPLDIRSILNAGWMFWLTHRRNEESNQDMSEYDQRVRDHPSYRSYLSLRELSSLVLRAIELSDFQRGFLSSTGPEDLGNGQAGK
jgi:hypothetical protein